MKTNLFKSLLVAVMAIGALGGVNAQTTTAFSQDFTAKTTESGEVSTDPIDYGFTKLNFAGNYTVANITDGKFTTKVGGTDKSHTENGTVEYCANFDAIGKGNIVTISFYWETGNATGRSNSSKSQIYISNSNGDKVLDIAFYGQDKLLKINNTTTKAMNRNSKVNVTSKINLSTNVIEELKVGTNTFKNIPFMTNDANDISKFVFLHTSGTKTSWSNESSIDNINITYEKLTVASADYTIKSVDESGNNIKKNIIKSSLVGENPIITEDDKSSFYNEDGTKKYIYVSDDAASKTIAEDGSTVVTVTYREAATYKYTVNNNINDYAVSGTAFEGDNAKVAFSQYILNDGVLYEANKIDNGKEYNWTFAVNEDNTVKTINYKKTDIDNVAYYSEAENIEGLTIINSGNSAIRSSNSASAYAKDADVVFTTLPIGKYKLTSVVCDFKGKDATAEFSFKAGEKVIFTHQAKNINYDKATSEEFTLNESTPISLVKGGNESQGVDYIYIQRTGDATETVSVSDAGYATYATKYNVEVPDNNDVKVMTVKVNAEGTAVELNDVAAGKVIPANTGILVKAAQGDYNFVVTSDAGTPLDNNLVAAKEAVKSDGATFFALTTLSDGKVGFAVVATGVKIPAGKAYLKVPAATTAKFFGLDGEATGINSVKTAKADGAYYTLEGVKTTKPVKGLYIHNGKKIVVK